MTDTTNKPDAKQLAIELFCGSCQYAQATRAKRPHALILCVDIRDRETLEEIYEQYDLKEFFKNEAVKFVQKDLRLLEPRDILTWCTLAGCQPRDIVGMHASFPCDLSTLANRINNNAGRDLQDTPLSVEAQWDEELRYQCIQTVKWLVRESPKALVTLENPWSSSFRKSPMIIELVRDPMYGFHIIREDLCATIGDKDTMRKRGKGKDVIARRITPKKPTALVIRGFHVERYLKKGERRCKKTECPMVYKGSKIHKRIIMSKSSGAKEKDSHNYLQMVVPKDLNSMLSIGMFEGLWDEHEEWLGDVGMDYYCAVCGNNNAEEESDCIACETEGCTRIQHSACSQDKRDGSADWRCDTCFIRQEKGLSMSISNYATEQYNRIEKLVEWLDRGLISQDQFQAMSAEVTATVPKPA